MPSSAIMCADVVLYSRLMGIDEEGTEYRGRTLRAVGDALPVEFNSVADAIRARSSFRRQFAPGLGSQEQRIRVTA